MDNILQFKLYCQTIALAGINILSIRIIIIPSFMEINSRQDTAEEDSVFSRNAVWWYVPACEGGYRWGEKDAGNVDTLLHGG